jgi:hypothetical protein
MRGFGRLHCKKRGKAFSPRIDSKGYESERQEAKEKRFLTTDCTDGTDGKGHWKNFREIQGNPW